MLATTSFARLPLHKTPIAKALSRSRRKWMFVSSSQVNLKTVVSSCFILLYELMVEICIILIRSYFYFPICVAREIKVVDPQLYEGKLVHPIRDRQLVKGKPKICKFNVSRRCILIRSYYFYFVICDSDSGGSFSAAFAASEGVLPQPR